jgi:hypothetical protein
MTVQTQTKTIQTQTKAKRVVLVGGVAPSMFNQNELTMYYKRITLDELEELAKDAEVVNFVRHESTVKLLSNALEKQLTPNAGLYTWQEGDILVIVGLKKPVRGQEMQIVADDLDLVVVYVYPGRWIP